MDFKKFTKQELLDRGWGMWDENIILAPPEDLRKIPDGTIMTGISNKQEPIKQDEIDFDTRYGCTAYGLFVKDLNN